MEKPLLIRMEEFRVNVDIAAKNSGLPAAVLELLLFQMLQNISSMSTLERQNAIQEWNQKNQEVNKGGDTDKAG